MIVFQHVAHELLGTLNPLLKEKGFRIRYINFGRHPDMNPSLDGYNGLVVLGGPMGVYEAEKHPHLKIECQRIEEALKKNIPILGVCLGSQLIAHVLGASVKKSKEKEIGWYDVHLTDDGAKDPLFYKFKKTEKIFQLHGDAFESPKDSVHLARSELCEGQAFRYGENVYGFQFHLEVDKAMIHRWLKVPANVADLESSGGKFTAGNIERETEKWITRSMELSQATFSQFIKIFGLKEKVRALGSGHGKPHRG
jgi:GMP synthase (glutamine-hydrolysing)